ncbi:4Fe-4S ferredoxin [Gordonibacter sp. An230]|uniref:4Fe-4S dicluster domain-containing protein n=1 Tax=Gordonibacter sp. An230 TaxID=1965592 RepID=UPI000B3A3CB8|nr:4Fe-4S dicluster domain-containing protein [Gordonibacter sp. An230]OUO91709.1 4Fe-4S ferredoxin [Gordonibacter sp. An230]
MAERLGMVIDMKACIACASCAVACKVENNLPDEVWWNRVLTDGGENPDTPAGVYPDLTMSNLVVACQHCENPACVKVCPVGATYKDSETGVVRQDYDKCIGCRMCMSACPYTGVRSFNWEEPRHVVGHALGDADVPAHQKHVVEKCTMCWHRLAKGLQPACVEVCPARVRYFGDLNDPDSEVSQLIRERECKQLLPSEGTNPSVYYLV